MLLWINDGVLPIEPGGRSFYRIGLAVFDKNRRLGLFNPALTDLVKIDAVWLAGRPSLRDFLERLRETRQMPEQKDFASWRRKLSELEEGSR